jgi:hypothetical protein|tara:strand:- start:167 stop:340 length:174 start_codon:yes stop_codon:yes gene_type:complete
MKLFNLKLAGINTRDYPDFCDAYISHAEDENGRELTDDELEDIPQEVVYEYVMRELY